MQYPSKIKGLIYLKKKGINVPPFFIISIQLIQSTSLKKYVNEQLKKSNICLTHGVSIRSSFYDEDNITKSNAGKYDSINGIKTLEELLDFIFFLKDKSEKDYNNKKGFFIIQETHVAAFSGVSYIEKTQDINLYSECYFGSCRSIVDGVCDPYRVLNINEKWNIYEKPTNIARFYANKQLFHKDKITLIPGKKVYTNITPFSNANRIFQAGSTDELLIYGYPPKVDNHFIFDILERLKLLLLELDDKFPLDIEWGVSKNYKDIYIYQIRSVVKSITTNLFSIKNIDKYAKNKKDLKNINGIPSAPGIASGYITSNKNQCHGKILMLAQCEIDTIHFLDECIAVISEKGGLLSHVAALCREKNIPCITGTGYHFSENEHLKIDGSKGIITRQ